MKLLAFLFAATIILAQPSSPPSVIYVTSDPAGACAASAQLRFNTSNGKLWGCNALTWTQIGGGGGGSPGAPLSSIQFNNAGSFGGITYAAEDLGYIRVTLVDDPTDALIVSLAGAGAGNVDNGSHCYAYTYSIADSDSVASAGSAMTYPKYPYDSVTVVDHTVNGKVTISGLPVSPDARVIRRIIFRSKANANCNDDSNLYFWGIINDNTTTTFTDNVADSSLTDKWVNFDLGNSTGGILVRGASGYPSNRLQQMSDSGIVINNSLFDGALDPAASSNYPGYVGILVIAQYGNARAMAFPGDATQFLNGVGGFSNVLTTVVFASLSTTNGIAQYCSDCKVTSGSDNTCVGSGSGAMAVRINGISKCLQ